jgi:NADPH-dependent 2,4-dienoyl-CoA reductase/sulfur reductase-like enzyme
MENLELDLFTGSIGYHRLYPGIILTDGALYLAEKGSCFWLMDVYASYLWLLDGNVEPFTVLRLTRKDNSTDVVIDDGNGNKLYTQHIEYTDFPLAEIKLYACWTENFWVLMLPSEY